MTDYKNHPDADKPLITSTGYHGKRASIKALVKQANLIGNPIPDYMWEALNNRHMLKIRVLRARWKRQRGHALQLQEKLAEKNAYILELQNEIATLKTPDFFAK